MKKKKKYNYGGPVTPAKDTTRVEPRAIVPVFNDPLAARKDFNPFSDGALIAQANDLSNISTRTAMLPDVTGKIKSTIPPFRERSLGGQLLQTGVSFIPGVGQILAPLVGMADQQIEQDKLKQEAPAPPVNLNMNPFGKLAMGGIINDNFKQYNAGSHASGNDQAVNADGTPVANSENTIQNRENSYQVKNEQYVFSDVLKKNGKAFNIHAAEINKKYPKARFQQDQRQGLDFEMGQLAKENDMARNKVESKQKRLGGRLDNGDPIIPPSSNLAWQAQSLTMPTLPTLTPAPVKSMGPQLITEPLDNGLATDSTTFGTELTPVGKNLSTAPLADTSTDRGNPLTLSKTASSPGILDSKTANTIGLVGKGLALAGSVADALSPAEEEKLITPDYRKADNYMQSANIDYTQARQDATGVSNIGAQNNRSLSSNAASYQGREQARLAGLSDQLSRISEAQNNAQSSLNLTKGQYEANKAVDGANREYQNTVNNAQNNANARFFDRTLTSELSQIGTQFNKFANQTKENQNNKELSTFEINQQLAILNSKYPNVKITPDIMEKLKSGSSIDEILKVSI